jgi:hypothetical protein
MLSLLIAAALGQCGSRASYGYARSYVAPTYQAYHAPQVTYQAVQPTYQQPAYNYSLVGDMLRAESQYQQQVQQNAKLDVLLKLLAERPAPPQVQPYQPPPTFATPQQPSKAPPVQYEQPQLPAKSSPQFEQPYQAQPSQQQWAPSDQPPYGTKPSPAAPPTPTPSFESSSWVPPVGGPGGGGGGVVAMTTVMQNRCVDCHVGSAEKGGGVKLLEIDGQLADISPYLDDIGKDVASGRMPKRGGRLNNQELYAVFAGLREYAATSRARQNVLASFGQ